MNASTRLIPVLLLGALAGCNSPAGLAVADPGLEKVNAYIECYNGVEQPIHEGFQTYTGWMKDPKAGPTARKRSRAHRASCCRTASSTAASR